MAKTKEELNALKEEVETLNKKLAELTEDELKQVTMSEEKKTVELKNEDLEKVAGGFTREPLPGAETHSFNCGDTFFKYNEYLHDIYIYI